MGKCEHCGREVENLIMTGGKKLCVECAVEAQKDLDPDSLNFTACM